MIAAAPRAPGWRYERRDELDEDGHRLVVRNGRARRSYGRVRDDPDQGAARQRQACR